MSKLYGIPRVGTVAFVDWVQEVMEKEDNKHMREFVYGTAAQYKALDQALPEERNYRYANRQLPDSCTPDTACLWFGKVNGSYRMCIDKGISKCLGKGKMASENKILKLQI